MIEPTTGIIWRKAPKNNGWIGLRKNASEYHVFRVAKGARRWSATLNGRDISDPPPIWSSAEDAMSDIDRSESSD